MFHATRFLFIAIHSYDHSFNYSCKCLQGGSGWWVCPSFLVYPATELLDMIGRNSPMNLSWRQSLPSTTIGQILILSQSMLTQVHRHPLELLGECHTRSQVLGPGERRVTYADVLGFLWRVALTTCLPRVCIWCCKRLYLLGHILSIKKC